MSKDIFREGFIEGYDEGVKNGIKQGRQDAIDKIKKYVYRNIHFYDAIEQKGFYEFLEQLKE